MVEARQPPTSDPRSDTWRIAKLSMSAGPKPGTPLCARTHSRVTTRDGETMPTLAQVIEALRAVKPDFRLFIEIKTSIEDEALSARAEEVAEAVIAELRRLDFRNCAILVGFDWAGLIHAKRLDPDVPCWFSTACNSPLDADAIRAAGGDGWFRSLHDRGPTRDALKERAGARPRIRGVDGERQERHAQPYRCRRRCDLHRPARFSTIATGSKPFEQSGRKIAFREGGNDRHDLLALHFGTRAHFQRRGDGRAR